MPEPFLLTDSVYLMRVNVAPTFLAADKVTAQVVVVPLHAPDHPVKLEPVVGAAVNVTTLPWSKLALHVAPQSIPAGADVTLPVPVPKAATVSATLLGASAVKLALTLWSVAIVKVQTEAVPADAQSPPQLAKAKPLSGVACKVTVVPRA